jgi:hypothetical protein
MISVGRRGIVERAALRMMEPAMRCLVLAALLSLVACQSTVTVNGMDAGPDGGTTPGGDGGGGGEGSITQATDAGVCNFSCTAPQVCATTGDCVTCLTDADCKDSQIGTHCETRPGSLDLFGTCVECVEGSQCGSGMSCNPTNDNCVPTCSDASCAANSTALICDPQSGTCVDCLTNSDCEEQVCDPVTLACVDCLQPSDCPAGQPGCYQGVCGQCNVSSNCPGSETCSELSCVCGTDQDCPSATPACILDGGPGVCGCEGSCTSPDICDPTQGLAGVCVVPCNAAGGSCLANTETGQSVCDTTNGLCVQCLSSTQCTDVSAPVCVSGLCLECGTNTDCGAADAGTPYCSQGLCVQCTSSSQCPADNVGCDSSSGSCGSCTYNSDCPAGLGCDENTSSCAPFCGTAGATAACAGCATSADCGGASCNADAGVCG